MNTSRAITHRSAAAAAGIVVLASAAVMPLSGAEAAEPLCFGLTPTLVGTSGDDEFTTVDGQVDIIYGGEGSDVLRSEGEDGTGNDPGDFLCGGPGNDYIGGGDGPDHINGGDGDDDVDGWRGTDVIQGNAGDDFVTDDSIFSNDRVDDTLRGGPGNDQMYGGWGADRLYGNRGHDFIYDIECDGPTRLVGGGGADHLESYITSYDALYCDDRFGATPDFLYGGGGEDSADASRRDVTGGVEFVTRILSLP